MPELLFRTNAAPGAIYSVLTPGSFPPPLSKEEEEFYLERWSRGDLEARNVLIERNLRLVAHILKKYYASAADQEDLISIGTIGLIKAITTYDFSRGTRLCSYAGRCIQNEILMTFRSQRKSQGDISLSDYIETTADGSSVNVMDVLSNDSDLFEQACFRSDTAVMHRGLREALSQRERDILILRYGLDQRSPMTQQQVAKQFGISRSYVSRIEKKALNKMKIWMEDSNIR